MGYTIVRNGRVLNIGRRDAPFSDVLIKSGTIEEIGAPGMQAPADAVVFDATDRLLMPGLVNAHTHGHGAIGKGLGDRWSLELLLNAGPWINAGRTLEHKYLSAKVGALEMLSKGCTACYDLYFEFPSPTVEGMEAVAQAYKDAGLRAVIAPMVADRSFFEAIPGLADALPGKSVSPMPNAAQTLAACKKVLTSRVFDGDHVRAALAPTIPMHCTDEFMIACRDMANELDVGLHTHLAESKLQAVTGMQRYGKTLTAHLDSLGVLSPRFTGAHCVWLDQEDISRIANHGGAIAHNPGSNLRLGSGIAAARQMLDAGVNVGVGTDGAHCSDSQNVFEAMRIAALVSRVREHDPSRWLGTDEVLRMATEGSAKVLGFGDKIGALRPGAAADISFIDLSHINYWPLNDPVNQLVLTEHGGAVASVMVNGDMIMQDGNFIREDMAKLRAEVDAAGAHLANASAEMRRLCEGLEKAVSGFCVGLAGAPYHVHGMASVGERH